MKKNLRTDIITILMPILLLASGKHARAQPLGVPTGSFPDIFTYYDPLSADIPPGADITSKSIILLEEYADRGTDLFRVGNGTTFLIRTFRDDNKVCMCLTGHQVNSSFSNGAQPIVGSSVHFNADIYMNYLGSDSTAQVNGNNYHFNKKATPFSKGYLSTGELAGYEYGEGNYDPDIALVLVDKRALPSPSFAALGYDFTDTAWSNNTYYSIGHPHAYPQRIMDGYSTSFINSMGTFVNITRPPPGYGGGPGASGSPVLNRPTGLSLTSQVRGVLYGPSLYANDNMINDLFSTKQLEYGHMLRFTKIGQIEHAIRQHCWQNKTASEILSGGLHKQSVQIDNSSGISPYTQNQSLTSATATASAAAGFTEYINNSTETTYLKANQCNISGFTLPAIYPGSTYSWQLTVAAKEINVNAGFDYTATGSSELHLASVVIGNTASAATQAIVGVTDLPQQATDTASGFAVYPNPSSSGVFYLSLPADNNGNGYHLKVFGTDGRQVYQGVIPAGQSTYRFGLTHLSRGAYILGVYKRQNSEKIFSKTIIY